jgi:hypothetical protein
VLHQDTIKEKTLMPFGSIWESINGLNDRLIALHSDPETFSFGVIAKTLSREFEVHITRNAVIGRARRISLQPRDPLLVLPRPVELKIKRQHTKAISPMRPLPPITKPACTPVSLADLEPHHCRFIVSAGSYCGSDKTMQSYCTYHHNLTHTPANQPRRRGGVHWN